MACLRLVALLGVSFCQLPPVASILLSPSVRGGDAEAGDREDFTYALLSPPTYVFNSNNWSSVSFQNLQHSQRLPHVGEEGKISPIGEGLSGSAPSAQGSQGDGQPQLFFLFLASEGLLHPGLWDAFFQGANSTQQYRVLMHCRSAERCRSKPGLQATAALVVDTVPTRYCSGLVGSMVHLLKKALPLSRSAQDKFVFLSDSTLPVKPFAHIYQVLTSDGDSNFCFSSTAMWAHIYGSGYHGVLPKHHQWAILSQEHATVLASRWNGDVEGVQAVQAPAELNVTVPVCDADDGKCDARRAAATTALIPRALLRGCTDEWLLFGMLYGVLIVQEGQTGRRLQGLLLNGSSLLLKSSVPQGACRTFAWWKFSNHSNPNDLLAHAIRNDTRSNVLLRNDSHPLEFLALSDPSVTKLRSSSFLFARKFARDAVTLEQFKRIIVE
mmetsp:Transcript_74077/g.176423  ORF Transcript_74077/g.176423 Transcript_74077/m.176423 type:complete len:440 (-) Transcript_74077:89-1408(-)